MQGRPEMHALAYPHLPQVQWRAGDVVRAVRTGSGSVEGSLGETMAFPEQKLEKVRTQLFASKPGRLASDFDLLCTWTHRTKPFFFTGVVLAPVA